MHKYIIIILVFSTLMCSAQEKPGAHILWTTYEAENMNTNGTVMGPTYTPFQVETESSGQRCVKLSTKDQYVDFTATINANSIVIRYSLPDKKQGGGTHSTLGLYKNRKLIQKLKISSQYSKLYGKYPFTNNPDSGRPRNFYDETRIKDIQIAKGDAIRIQLNNGNEDDAEYAIIDLVDLENIAAPLSPPSNSLSIADKSFGGSDADEDYTKAFRNCIAMAVETGKSVWIPPGTFKITGDIMLPSNIKIQGAGMWYSTFVGDEILYADANKRVRLKGNGSNIHLSDFAILGKLNYRSDKEPNDGIVGSYGTNSTISNLWIEHTKVGMWIENSKGLLVEGCRMRNTLADGINFCVGMAQSTIENCTTRGTGDDCFAMWPTTFMKQEYSPGENLISHCTAQLPFLANGAAIYGGKSNKVKDCSFIDISPGSAILISTTFPTEDSAKHINNNFSGTTLIENCDIRTSGGFDHEWGWRAAVQICLDKRSISGIEMNNINIENSLSDGLSVIAKNVDGKISVLSNAVLENIKIGSYGIGTKAKHGLWVANDAHGSLTLKNSTISEMKNESENFVIH
ncbi:MAG: right-handed parallel beta-helix repeat-containing protein [Bacteroidota bacterium]|nr:right-handed parallel beta-helix repeat-containing protein [Bacteroidota bacterium]